MESLAGLNLFLGVILLVLGVFASGFMLVFGLILVGQYGTPNESWLPFVLLVPLLPGPLFIWAGKLISRRSPFWPWVQGAAIIALAGSLYFAGILLAGDA